MGNADNAVHREPWNTGKLVGQKAPFKLKDIWTLRVRLQMEGRVRELALFNLGIDSNGDQVAARAIVVQHKTQRPVQFEITPAARDAVQAWIKLAGLKSATVSSRLDADLQSRIASGQESTRGMSSATRRRSVRLHQTRQTPCLAWPWTMAWNRVQIENVGDAYALLPFG